jgi:hypothetical protein
MRIINLKRSQTNTEIDYENIKSIGIAIISVIHRELAVGKLI